MGNRGPEYKIGQIVYKPYAPPTPVPGAEWIVAKKHHDKRYPLEWRLVSADPNIPPEDPPKGSLPIPKDIGIPEWQKREIGADD